MIEHLIKAATCRVVCGTESGTGWLIGKCQVVTARHCLLASIDEGQPVELFFQSSVGGVFLGKIVAVSEDWDTCILSLESTPAATPMSVSIELPREGENWQAFGYPQSKATLGHRLTGNIAQVLETPNLKIDLDLSIDTNVGLRAYGGMSGAAVVCDGMVVGMIRLKVDGTIAALSLNLLESFLAENGVDLPRKASTPSTIALADRGDFPDGFAKEVQKRSGSFLFLEGAHGYGKSTFCRYFRGDERRLINLGAYCLSDSESALGANYRAHPQVFLDWLTTKISGLIYGKPPRKEDKSYLEQIQQTYVYLDEFSKYCAQSGRQGMFFIDGLNEIPSKEMLDALLGLLPAVLPPHVTVILTAPNFGIFEVPLTGKVKKSDVLGLPPLPDSACYNYCLEALKPTRRSSAIIDRICEKAKGHPLYLRYLIEYANHQATDEDLDDFPILTGPIEEYYRGIWAKLLPDGDAVNLLAMIARLRWGLSSAEFAKILSPSELAQFVSVMSRNRHLFADDESTAIYHLSFAAFIVEQTTGIAESVHRRLAKFCCDEPSIRYCALNRVFHLSLAADNAVFSACDQAWFDTAVTLGVEPDALIADVDKVVKRAAIEGTPNEFFRLTLLAQRISFRYNTLFAQSAHLIAEALIVLGRPSEALHHVIRNNTLIVGLDDALKIAFLLHKHGFNNDGLTLLARVQQRLVEGYGSSMSLNEFLHHCSCHIRTVFMVRLADGWNGMRQVMKLTDMARQACEDAFEENPSQLDEFLCPIFAIAATYFLTFTDEYADLERLDAYKQEEGLIEREIPMHHLKTLCLSLLNFEATVDNYHLAKGRKSLTRLFLDLEELIQTIEIEAMLSEMVADTLIRFGAPSSCVLQFTQRADKQTIVRLSIRAENGVDVNHARLLECANNWRIAAFVDSSYRGPTSGVIEGTSWLELLEHLIGSLYCCDGRARRAKADSDEPSRIACLAQLKVQVIEPLRFTLQQRAAWVDSYAIPENALPGVYQQLAELLIDCFPEELHEWLDDLIENADGQWGMYSEGYRASVYQVLKQLTRERPSNELASKLLGLMHTWRDHVLSGVENRHELVPEILRMIPIYSTLGAIEEAQRLYQRLLSVSMGPTWYKEDQLGIMTEVLGSICVSDEVVRQLPKVAGYLERASGEMTFQRYVRAEKSALLGQIARQGRFHAALAYFRRQCCGSLAELWAEAQQGTIDNVGPFKGNRFPGGAIDDQAAVLALVRNSGAVSWELRWALLEIFHCGDRRHLTDYAEAYANIANEVGALPELVRRVEIVVNAETSSDDMTSFASAFRSALRPELHATFAPVLSGLPPFIVPRMDPSTSESETTIEEEDSIPGLFQPGVIGRSKALRNADKILEEAEKQWVMGNRNAAKEQAVKVLQTAQDGGWSIWGNLSASAQRAEEILVQEEDDAAKVIRYYAPLIEADGYVPKWIPAQHLIGKVGPLLNETEGQKLLDGVINHFRYVVGDAPNEIQAFEFLAANAPERRPDVEFFGFIVWLCNHPQWLRRDRAAAMLLWLVDQVPDLFPDALTTAFSMDEGYGPDVICGVLDGISARDPVALWDKISDVLDLTKVTQELRHISRMVVLERLATRADKAGSFTARAARTLIGASFSGKRGACGTQRIPIWARRLAQEWPKIVNLVSAESMIAWQTELERSCIPLSVTDALTLEAAVATSFREGRYRPFDRWESRLRHALNVALWQKVSKADADEIEAVLRIYNPSQPERTVLGMCNNITDQLIAAFQTDDYSAVFGSSSVVLLNYHDMAVRPTEDGSFHVEILCLVQPKSDRSISYSSQTNQCFRSSELPVASSLGTAYESCCRLEPEVVFLGPFTPATPLLSFQILVGAKNDDFVRQNWRYGRKNRVHGFGQPERAGCSLSILRSALKIPPGFKLAWLIRIDGEIVAIVEEENNQFFKK